MPIVRDPSRLALRSAADSTVKTIGSLNYTTLWDYQKGRIATTDPNLAKKLAVGAFCVSLVVSVAPIVVALWTTPRRPALGRGW